MNIDGSYTIYSIWTMCVHTCASKTGTEGQKVDFLGYPCTCTTHSHTSGAQYPSGWGIGELPVSAASGMDTLLGDLPSHDSLSLNAYYQRNHIHIDLATYAHLQKIITWTWARYFSTAKSTLANWEIYTSQVWIVCTVHTVHIVVKATSESKPWHCHDIAHLIMKYVATLTDGYNETGWPTHLVSLNDHTDHPNVNWPSDAGLLHNGCILWRCNENKRSCAWALLQCQIFQLLHTCMYLSLSLTHTLCLPTPTPTPCTYVHTYTHTLYKHI